MLYIVEIPHQRPPRVWYGFDQKEILNALRTASSKTDESIYENYTGQEYLDMFGYETTQEMREDNEEFNALADLIDQHGLDTFIYKGFKGDYQIEEVDELESYLEWNADDLYKQMVFMSDEEAKKAVNNDSIWRIHQGFEAQIALEELLTELCD